MEGFLALELAGTIRHDGSGGVADDLATTAGLTEWVRTQQAAGLLDESHPGAAAGFVADEAARRAVVEVRQAVRALLARAVRPGPPSPADANRLLPTPQAVARLNAAAARVPLTPRLEWEEEEGANERPPRVRQLPGPGGGADATDRLTAELARAAMDFLAGPWREKLRACTAPRCVRYFVKGHGRQEWCKPSCGNRARVARHHQRRRVG
ncbi:CGNR zinc finger domain-containing protein [Streptomyces sp. 4N509B]|uniref:CGNR zinc finger domain-containing protein n=1 Tax=Streptomyces sp. 4N509B TaxID=3457413 RepID=UPI003FD09921